MTVSLLSGQSRWELGLWNCIFEDPVHTVSSLTLESLSGFVKRPAVSLAATPEFAGDLDTFQLPV